MQHDHEEIRHTLTALFPPGDVFEVRCLDAVTTSYRRPHTEAGFFDNADAAVKAIGQLEAVGIYVTINGIQSDLLARANNRFRTGGKNISANDQHVQQRRWLPVDIDPVRTAGVSATDAEKQLALDRCRKVYAWLRGRGWPDPLTADSGNGFHLLYSIDEPTADDHLIENCLKALAAMLDDNQVAIDTSVFNPSRIVRLYGTVAAKGDSTADRPHRQSKIINLPGDVVVVSHEKLAALAATAPQRDVKPRSTYNRNSEFDLRKWIVDHVADLVDAEIEWNGGWKRQFKECPFNPDHKAPDSFIGQRADGPIVACCSHNSCNWTWKDLRERFDPADQRKASPPQSTPRPLAVSKNTVKQGVDNRLSQYRRGPLPRVELGLPALDKQLGGGVPYGSLVVVGALSSHGKTAFGLQCAHWICCGQQLEAMFISLEMSVHAIADRVISFASGVPRENWHQAVERLEHDTKLHFDGAADCILVEGLTRLDDIAREIERFFQGGGRVVIVDYAQLVAGDSKEDGYSAMRSVSAALKRLATDHDAIIICLAQLNKRVENKKPLVPTLSDIDYGSKLAHDADVVLALLWRHKLDSRKPANEYEIFITKNRNGDSNTCIHCKFNPPRQTITETAPPAPKRYDFGEYGDDPRERKDLF